jgi:fucose permease
MLADLYAAGVQQPHDPADYRLLHAVALMALFGVGVYAASFGPTLPFLARDLGVSLDTAGLLLTALFVGSISASASVAIALHSRHPRVLSAWGLGAATCGVTLLAAAPSWPVALLGGAILGIGDGLVVAALHILMGLTSRDVPSAINRLNLFFALGAMAGPVWAGIVLSSAGEHWIVFAGIAAYEVLTFALMLAAKSPAHEQGTVADEQFRLPGNPTSWIMGGVLFLYVGAEFGLGTWVSSYARETAHAGVLAGALLTSGYWAALALGRVVSGVYFGRERDPGLLLIVSIAGAGISALTLALVPTNVALSAAGAFGAGLCFGPIWPTTIAIASEGAQGNVTAATVTLGNAGGMVIPWLQGRILVGAGPRQGVGVTAVLCAIMFGITGAFRSKRGRAA